MSYLYILSPKGSERPIKIGIASDPEQRLRQLQTGNPAPIKVVASFKGASREQVSCWEAEAHKLFAERRISGEWFDLTASEVIAEIAAWKVDRPRRVVRKPSKGSCGFRPFHPAIPENLARKPTREMTRAERIEFWACYGLDEPPIGFDDWYVIGNSNMGVIGAFPVEGFMHGEPN